MLIFAGTSFGQRGQISVEAVIAKRSGEIVRIARTEFYLLDENVLKILKDARLRPATSNGSGSGAATLSDIALSVRYGQLPGYRNFSENLFKAVKPHIKYIFETDYNGRAILRDVPPGKYFLFGMGQTQESGIAWNIGFDTAETNMIFLGGNNGVIAY